MITTNSCTRPYFDSIPSSFIGTPAPYVLNSFSRKGIHEANRLGYIQAQKKTEFAPSVFLPHSLKAESCQPAQRPPYDNASAASALLVIVLFFTAIRIASRRMHELWTSFVALRFLFQLSREGSLFSRYGVLPMYLLFLFSTALLITQFLHYQQIEVKPRNGYIAFLGITALIFLLYAGKSLLFKFMGVLIQMKKEFADYIFQFSLFNLFFGLAIAPVVFANRFLSLDLQGPLFVFCFALFVLLYLYRIIRGVSIFGNNTKFSKFQLFLYLCTLEILPWFLLAKLLQNVLKA